MSTLSPNMSLIIPTVGIDSGLAWEQGVNANTSILDGHNHSGGSGVPINVSGMSIDNDLPFNNFSPINQKSSAFNSQAVALVGTDFLSFVNGEFFVNDGAGNQVQVTSGGTVNATASGIASGTATASFVSSVLTVFSAVNTPAAIRSGSLIIGNTGIAGSNYLTLSPPSALASSYSLTLPIVPGVKNIMTLDTSGNMAGDTNVDNSTIVMISNTIRVPSGGITNIQIAPATIVGANIAANTIDGGNSGNIIAGSITLPQISSSTLAFGTFIPALTPTGGGIGGFSTFAANWIRVGNAVQMAGRVDIVPSGTPGSLTTFSLTLPFGAPSNQQLAGVLNSWGYSDANIGATYGGSCIGGGASGASFTFNQSGSLTNTIYNYVMTYTF